MYYSEIFKAFKEASIDYLLVRGLAVNLHGIPRVTQDMDIIIRMKKENIEKTHKTLEHLGYKSRIPGMKAEDLASEKTRKRWVNERNLKAVSYYHEKDDYKVVDIVLVHPLNFDKASNRKVFKRADDIDIPLATVEDIIKMMQKSAREQDISDIDLLKKIKNFKNK